MRRVALVALLALAFAPGAHAGCGIKYPASHGCARVPMWVATTVFAAMPPGSTVYVYT